MVPVFRAAALCEFALTLLKEVLPQVKSFIPHDGNSLAQTGLVLGIAYVLYEWNDMNKPPPGGPGRRRAASCPAILRNSG